MTVSRIWHFYYFAVSFFYKLFACLGLRLIIACHIPFFFHALQYLISIAFLRLTKAFSNKFIRCFDYGVDGFYRRKMSIGSFLSKTTAHKQRFEINKNKIATVDIFIMDLRTDDNKEKN